MMTLLGKVMKPRYAVTLIICLSALFVMGVFYTHLHIDSDSLPNIHVNDFSNREATNSLRGNQVFEPMSDALRAEHSDQHVQEEEKESPHTDSEIDAIENLKQESVEKAKDSHDASGEETDQEVPVPPALEVEKTENEIDITTAKDLKTAVPLSPINSTLVKKAPALPNVEGRSAAVLASPVELMSTKSDKVPVVIEALSAETVPPITPSSLPLLDTHFQSFGSHNEADLFTSLLLSPFSHADRRSRRECVTVTPTSFGLSSARDGAESSRSEDISAGEVEGIEIVKLVKRAFTEGQVFDSAALQSSLVALTDAIARHLVIENMTIFVEMSSYSDAGMTVSHAIASAYANITSVRVDSRPLAGSSSPDLELVDVADSVLCASHMSAVLRPDPINLYLVQDRGNAALFPTASVMNGVQFIDNLGDFVDELLPFEFEERVREVLCRARYSYIAATFFAAGNSEFFSYWSSVSAFVGGMNKLSGNGDDGDGKSKCVLSLDFSSEHNMYLKKHGGMDYVVVERVVSASSSSTLSSASNHEPNLDSGILVGRLLAAKPLSAQVHKIMAMVVGSRAENMLIGNWSSADGVYVNGESMSTLVCGWLDAFSIVQGSTVVVDAAKLGAALNLFKLTSSMGQDSDNGIASLSSSTFAGSHTSRFGSSSGVSRQIANADFSANSAHSKNWWQSGRKLMGTFTLGSESSSGKTLSSSSHGGPWSSSSSSKNSGSSSSSSSSSSSTSSSSSSSTSSSSSSGKTASSGSSNSGVNMNVELLSSLTSKRQGTFRKRLLNSPLTVQFGNNGGSVNRDYLPDRGLNHYITEDKSEEEGKYWLKWPAASSVEKHLRDKKYSVTAVDSFSAGSSVSVDDDMRLQQQTLQRREATVYARWMRVLKSSFGADVSTDSASANTFSATRSGSAIHPMEDFAAGRLVYVAGRDVSLLSIKMARTMYTRHQVAMRKAGGASASAGLGLVVSLLSDPGAVQPHEYLLEAMALPNNVLCSAQLHLSQLDALSRAPERGSVALYQVDVTMRLYSIAFTTTYGQQPAPVGDISVCESFHSTLEKLFAVLLGSADIVYIEMPSAERLLSLLTALRFVDTTASSKPEQTGLDCANELLKKNELVNASASAVFALGLFERSIARLSLSSSQNRATRPPTYRISELAEPSVRASTSFSASAPLGSVIYRLEHLHLGHEEVPTSVVHSSQVRGQGVSVYTLMHMGVLQSFKRKLLKMLTEFPIRNYKQGADSNAGDKDDILSKLLPWTLFVDTDTVGGETSKNKDKSPNRRPSHGVRLSFRYGSSVVNSAASSKFNLGVAIPSRTAGDGVIDMSGDSFASEQREANLVFSVLMNEFNNHRGELAGGKFSCVEHSSGQGFLSMLLASRFPNATLVSMEDDYLSVRRHEYMLEELNITNNYIAHTSSSSSHSSRLSVSSSRSKILKNLYDSPEMFRFQIVSKGLIEASETDSDRYYGSDSSVSSNTIGNDVGTLLSLALTSFIRVPSSTQVSWSMTTLHSTGMIDGLRWRDNSLDAEQENNVLRGDKRMVSLVPVRPHAVTASADAQGENEGVAAKALDEYLLKSHPAAGFEEFESYWLLGNVKLPQSSGSDSATKVVITPLWLQGQRVPWVRCDIVNMTRHVHHHYDYAKDGHKRTYTMHIGVNHTVTQSVNNLIDNQDPSEMISVQHPKGILLFSKALYQQHDSNLKAPEDVVYRTVYPDDSLLNIPDYELETLSEHELAMRREDMSVKLQEDAERRKSAQYPLLLPSGLHPNQHQITAVHLHRDRDNFPIPYTSVYGITLITALRLGIVSSQIDRLYRRFLRMPLYEDMAPWNIVLMGSSVDYIDYDTRDMIFDWDIPKAYQIMTVLMNYKRTVEDFSHCGSKASTVYGLPYVSDCVGSTNKAGSSTHMPTSCPDLKKPVPCGDGECHSDYISCLRSFADISAKEDLQFGSSSDSSFGNHQSKSVTIAEAIRSGIASFNDKGLV